MINLAVLGRLVRRNLQPTRLFWGAGLLLLGAIVFDPLKLEMGKAASDVQDHFFCGGAKAEQAADALSHAAERKALQARDLLASQSLAGQTRAEQDRRRQQAQALLQEVMAAEREARDQYRHAYGCDRRSSFRPLVRMLCQGSGGPVDKTEANRLILLEEGRKDSISGQAQQARAVCGLGPRPA